VLPKRQAKIALLEGSSFVGAMLQVKTIISVRSGYAELTALSFCQFPNDWRSMTKELEFRVVGVASCWRYMFFVLLRLRVMQKRRAYHDIGLFNIASRANEKFN